MCIGPNLGLQSDSKTGNSNTGSKSGHKDGAQSSPTKDLNDWSRHCGSLVAFPWLQNSAWSGNLATAGIKKAAQKTVPETKPEVVRIAGQFNALQLPNVLADQTKACAELAATKPYMAEFALLQTG